MAEITATIRDTQGNAKIGWTVQVRASNGVTIVSTTANGTVSDQGNGSYITTNSPPAGTYDIYACASGGTPALVKGYDNIRHVEYPLPEGLGGTGLTALTSLPAALNLEIGVDVQAHDDQLDNISGSIAALDLANVDGIAAFDNASSTAAFIPIDTARSILNLTDSLSSRQSLGVEPGVDVQGYDAHLDELITAIDAASGDEFLGIASGFATNWTATEARTALGLGTSATVNYTTTGEKAKIVKTNDAGAICVPQSDGTIAANASTLGQLFTKITGNTTTGTYSVLVVVITGVSGGNYTYGFKEIYASSWGGA